VVGIKLVLNIPTSMASEKGVLHRSYPFNAAINVCKHVMSNCAILSKADGQMFYYRTTLSGGTQRQGTDLLYDACFREDLAG